MSSSIVKYKRSPSKSNDIAEFSHLLTHRKSQHWQVEQPSTLGETTPILRTILMALFAIFTCIVCSNNPVQAASKRASAPWFEIEVVLFSYSRSPANVQERFPLGASPLPAGRKIDLLTPYHYQDITKIRRLLPTCSNQPVFGQYFQADFAPWFLNDKLPSRLPQFTFYYNNETAAPELLVSNTFSETSTNSTLQEAATQGSYQDIIQSTDNDTDQNTVQGLDINDTDNIGSDQVTTLQNIDQPTPADFESTGVIDFFAINKELSAFYSTLDSDYSPDLLATSLPNQTQTIDWQSLWQQLQHNQQQINRSIVDVTCNHYPSDPFALFIPSTHDQYEYAELPRLINASIRRDEEQPHLLTQDELKLSDVYQTLKKQPDIRPILHTGWRQKGYQEQTAIPVRLYAGIRYQKFFDEQGLARIIPAWQHWQNTEHAETSIPQNESTNSLTTDEQQAARVQDNIQKLLLKLSSQSDTETIASTERRQSSLPKAWKTSDPLWEIDGLFKIFMRGRYLNFDATFNVRRPSAFPEELSDAMQQSISPEHWQAIQAVDGNKQYLYNYQFSQKRRVITTEVHYFDHPFMGIVVQARRWGW